MNRNEIIKDLSRTDGKFNTMKCRESYLDGKGYTEFLHKSYPWAESVTEMLYCLKNDIRERPVCPVCGKPIRFASCKTYKTYCSVSCSKRAELSAVVIECDDDVIVRELVFPEGSLINNRLQDRYLKEHGLYDYLRNRFGDIDITSRRNHTDNPKAEAVWRIYNKVYERPACPVCGRPAVFTGWDSGYSGCSYNCRNIARFRDGIRGISKKGLRDLLEISGHLNKNLIREDFIEKSGIGELLAGWWPGYSRIDALWCLWNCRDRLPECPECGRVLHPCNTQHELTDRCCSSRCAARHKRREAVRRICPDLELIYHDDGTDDITVKNLCGTHGDVRISAHDMPNFFADRIYHNRFYDTKVICPICNPVDTGPTSIETIMAGILDSLGIDYMQHYRRIEGLRPKELDFWIPDYNTGIECNGTYWHAGFDRHRHDIGKRRICEGLGIRLLTFWEDDIKDHPDKIEGFLKSLFNLNDNIVGARKCEIREVPSQDCREFLESYHLQGNVNAPVRLGLYYGGELVEVMTFGRRRRNMGVADPDPGDWELYRLCTKAGWTVQGGASRLLSRFMKIRPDWKSVVSYCHVEISDGGIYEKLGFTRRNVAVKPGYSYVKSGDYHRINRFRLRKSEIDDGSGRTADEILESLGYAKCWDAGNTVWEIRRT